MAGGYARSLSSRSRLPESIARFWAAVNERAPSPDIATPEVIADTVQFLGGRDDSMGAGSGGGGGNQFVPVGAGGGSSPDADFGGSSADDDIPF